MEEEGIEQQILLQPESAVVGAVYSVNGYTGHVVLKTSDLENDSGYQTASDINSAINEHNEDEFAHPYLQTLIGTKQDELTPGVNINISSDNVISATDTTYSAGNGININGENAISVDTTVVATQQNLANEVTNRENADNALQAQIDGISASSDVVDIVGTYAELQQYDTQSLKDNDIIKVLQDETQGGATTYYRWSTSTSTFTLIGQEGPYYTKAAADAQFVPQTRTVNGKALSSNITLNASDVSALGTSDVVQTTGSSTSQVMSQNAVTTQLNTKLDASDYVVDTQLADSSNPVQNRVINNLLGNMPTDFFTAGENVSGEGTDITLNNTISAPLESVELDGDTYQQTYSGKNLFNMNSTTITTSSASASVVNNKLRVSNDYAGSSHFVVFKIGDTQDYAGLSLTLKSNWTTSSTNTGRIYIGTSDSAGNNRTLLQSTTTSGESITATIPTVITSSNNTLVLVFYSNNNSAQVGDYVDYSQTQLEQGSSASPFEPYVGGTASPNPDYPQDVQVVTGEQTVTVTGKNLFNKDNITLYYYIASDGTVTSQTQWCITDYIAVRPETNYTYSGITNAGTAPYSAYYDKNKQLISTFKQTINPTTITTPPEAMYVRFSINLGGSPSDIYRFQLEYGSTATTYEPYQGNNYTVDLGSTELCKIGDYQDYIYKSGDDWYVHKACGKVVLDGSENWGYAGSGTQTRLYITLSDIALQAYSASTPIVTVSNAFTGTNWYQFYTTAIDNVMCSHDSSHLLIVRATRFADASAFGTWLSTHNTTVYYALATPTDTKITDSTLIGQLEALYNAKTYLGTTSFLTTTTGTNLPVILDIEAYRKSLAGILGAIERLSE